MSEQRSCGVAFAGAGLSGLQVARLVDRDGIDVLVLEAQDRVGGRTL
jgi:monoamine oxidase